MLHKRRRAYRLRAWHEYESVVQHELDMEKLKFLDVANYVVEELQLETKAYKSSYAKYAQQISRLIEMKDARRLVLQSIENKHIEDIEFNEEMLDVPTVLKIIKFYEASKIDVLQNQTKRAILGSPPPDFKRSGVHLNYPQTEKERLVLELAVSQAKIEDQIYFDYGKVEFLLFIKAARHYGFYAANGKTELSRDAAVLSHNFATKPKPLVDEKK